MTFYAGNMPVVLIPKQDASATIRTGLQYDALWAEMEFTCFTRPGTPDQSPGYALSGVTVCNGLTAGLYFPGLADFG